MAVHYSLQIFLITMKLYFVCLNNTKKKKTVIARVKSIFNFFPFIYLFLNGWENLNWSYNLHQINKQTNKQTHDQRHRNNMKSGKDTL